MLLKIMSGEDVPDSDPRKLFQLHDGVLSVRFHRPGPEEGEDEPALAETTFKIGGNETFDVPSNAYIMNEQGKTVASFSAHPYVPLPSD